MSVHLPRGTTPAVEDDVLGAHTEPDGPTEPTGPSRTPPAEDLLRRLRAGELVPGFPDLDVVEPAQEVRRHRPAGAGATGKLSGAVRDRLPVAVRTALVDPALRGALGLGLVALIAALVALGLVWRGAPRPVAVPSAPVVSGTGGTTATGGGAAVAAAGPALPASASPVLVPARVFVDVAGKVRRPGVVSLTSGARVQDALRQAGGVLPGTDTSALSLARRVVDGEQILVTGKPGSAPATAAPDVAAPDMTTSPSGGGGAAPAAGAPLDLNSATVDQLDALPGVGPVLAGRIIEWRTAHGSFRSPDDLRQVKGLGGKTGSELLPLVRVG